MKKNFNRRSFLKETSKVMAGGSVIAAFTNFNWIPLTHAGTKEGSSKSTVSCEFGVEGAGPREIGELDQFLNATRDLGAEFLVCWFTPENFNPAVKPKPNPFHWESSIKDLDDLSSACKKYNMSFFINQEITNCCIPGEYLDKEGKDIMAHADKTHRWDLTGKLLDRAMNKSQFRGVLYDECEHGQLRRKSNTNGDGGNAGSGRIHPYFAATDGMTLEMAYESVYKTAKEVAANYRSKGIIPMTENVFPMMQFIFARAGFDIGIKMMKESLDPIYSAIAIGAARQYGTDFCAAPDLWGFGGKDWDLGDHFPGHPAEELRASLLFAYWMGSTRIFVENIRGLIEKKKVNGHEIYYPTEYGKVYKWFVKEYVPAHPRSYTFRDIQPEVAILRFEDTDWGQKDSRFTDNLYGAENLHTSLDTSAWFRIWKLLTHDQSNANTISYNSKGYKDSHDFFYPLKGVIVYDHLAGEKELQGLKLVFLTGVKISPETLKAVRKFVRNGGLCISLSTLAPDEFKGNMGKIKDGSGEWLFVKNFHAEEVPKAVAPYLGKSDEITYHIGKQRLTVKKGKDRNSISIYLQNENEDSLSETSQVY